MLSLAPTRPRARAILAVCAALAAVPVAAGCGENRSGSSGAGDPASVVPAAAPLYGEAVVRPEGDQKAKLESLLRRIMRTDDPGAKIESLFDRALRKDGITYAHDIEPWLGKRAGAFLSSVSRGGDPQGALIIATTDSDKALEAARKGEKVRTHKTYRGVGYDVLSRDRTAVAVVKDFLVGGTEAALRQVIDTSKDGKALADKAEYGDARGEAGSDGLVTAYVDPDGLIGLAASTGIDPAAVTALRQGFAGAAGKAAAASISPEDGGFSVAGAAIGLRKTTGPDGDAAGAVAAVPGDAWLAFGIGNLGSKLDDAIAQAGRVGGFAGIGIDTVLNQLKARSGIDLREDVLSWMGDSAIFVRGTSKGSVGGALVVRSKDPQKSTALVGKLATFLRQQNVDVRELSGVGGVDRGLQLSFGPGSPQVFVAAAGNRFVVAVGRSSLLAALRPAGRLGANATFRRAASQLGEGIRPSFYLDLASVLKLVEATGSGTDPDFRKAKPYLQAFTAIVAGGERDGDTGRGQAFVGVR